MAHPDKERRDRSPMHRDRSTTRDSSSVGRRTHNDKAAPMCAGGGKLKIGDGRLRIDNLQRRAPGRFASPLTHLEVPAGMTYDSADAWRILGPGAAAHAAARTRGASGKPPATIATPFFVTT